MQNAPSDSKFLMERLGAHPTRLNLKADGAIRKVVGVYPEQGTCGAPTRLAGAEVKTSHTSGLLIVELAGEPCALDLLSSKKMNKNIIPAISDTVCSHRS